ncbi:winged helix-turn-helix domain-containing protein [Tessaracoccus antarcticus]|uniref:Transcriptional regulator n=1 Tax=Tessaracoccus antarcticus TaxID=2479848 RepID=A0A3M0G9T2_9ACTN|nr:transcriptional regulator [Tessaracoccus antarcticus]RMB61690.1 transcriptional regulator [Tessaracoccus antarcticus]
MTTPSESHPRHRLDDLLHAPIRFSIIATLGGADNAEFSFVRDTIEVSDSVLSKQVSTLEAAGYVKVKKGYVGKRPRTWLSLTPSGRAAFEKHLEALREIANS